MMNYIENAGLVKVSLHIHVLKWQAMSFALTAFNKKPEPPKQPPEKESKTESKTVPHVLIRLNTNGQKYHGFPRYRPIEAVPKPAKKEVVRVPPSNPNAAVASNPVKTLVRSVCSFHRTKAKSNL